MEAFIKIDGNKNLPEYGKDVLVIGKNNKMYGDAKMHVCSMDDLEDGMDFKENGDFYWLTENGTKIEDVTHWTELPDYPISQTDR